MKNDNSGTDDVLCRSLYEEFLATLFTTLHGIIMTSRKAETPEWIEFKLQLRSTRRGPCPKFNDMECDVLYWPSDDNFPAVEFFYRSEEGRLVAFQVSRQRSNVKSITESAYKSFLNHVGLEDSTKVTLILVPTPAMATASSIVFVPLDKIPRLKSDAGLQRLTQEELLLHITEDNITIRSKELCIQLCIQGILQFVPLCI